MNKTQIHAEIVGHSLNPQGDELISVLCTFPRIILAEVNTHRMLSKNTSSSRAIPFNKMVEAVQNNPFIPIAWQKEHTGMQGYEYIIDKENIQTCIDDWLIARNSAIESAENLNKGFNRKNEQGNWIQTEEIDFTDKVTKQLCNRLLEPFMWTTMLITGSKEGWDNFFDLRCGEYGFVIDGNEKIFKSKNELLKSQWGNLYKDNTKLQWLQMNKGQAEIHMMALAEEIYDAVNESTPRKLAPGQWHIPFYEQITNLLINELVDGEAAFILDEKIAKISVAMAAHTSYTVVGSEVVKSSKKWLELHDRLLSYDPPHSSPLEHVAQVPNQYEYDMALKEEEKGWFYNLKGFKSYRYIIDNKIKL